MHPLPTFYSGEHLRLAEVRVGKSRLPRVNPLQEEKGCVPLFLLQVKQMSSLFVCLLCFTPLDDNEQKWERKTPMETTFSCVILWASNMLISRASKYFSVKKQDNKGPRSIWSVKGGSGSLIIHTLDSNMVTMLVFDKNYALIVQYISILKNCFAFDWIINMVFY